MLGFLFRPLASHYACDALTNGEDHHRKKNGAALLIFLFFLTSAQLSPARLIQTTFILDPPVTSPSSSHPKDSWCPSCSSWSSSEAKLMKRGQGSQDSLRPKWQWRRVDCFRLPGPLSREVFNEVSRGGTLGLKTHSSGYHMFFYHVMQQQKAVEEVIFVSPSQLFYQTWVRGGHGKSPGGGKKLGTRGWREEERK